MKSMTEEQETKEAPAPRTLTKPSPKVQSRHRPRVVIAGIGGAGNAGVAQIGRRLDGINQVVDLGQDDSFIKLVGFDTDGAHIDLLSTEYKKDGDTHLPIEFVPIGEGITGGLSTGGDPEKGKKAFLKHKDVMLKEFVGRDLVIIMAGVGYGTGGGAAPLLIEELSAQSAQTEDAERGQVVLGIFITPQLSEGIGPIQQTEQALLEVAKARCPVALLNMDNVAAHTEGNGAGIELSLQRYYEQAKEPLADMIVRLIVNLSRPCNGLTFDFPYLERMRNILQQQEGFSSLMYYGVGEGTDILEALQTASENFSLPCSAKDCVCLNILVEGEKLLASDFLKIGKFIEQAGGLGVSWKISMHEGPVTLLPSGSPDAKGIRVTMLGVGVEPQHVQAQSKPIQPDFTACLKVPGSSISNAPKSRYVPTVPAITYADQPPIQPVAEVPAEKPVPVEQFVDPVPNQQPEEVGTEVYVPPDSGQNGNDNPSAVLKEDVPTSSVTGPVHKEKKSWFGFGSSAEDGGQKKSETSRLKQEETRVSELLYKPKKV
jgi:cell division GTPase FtsZ